MMLGAPRESLKMSQTTLSQGRSTGIGKLFHSGKAQAGVRSELFPEGLQQLDQYSWTQFSVIRMRTKRLLAVVAGGSESFCLADDFKDRLFFFSGALRVLNLSYDAMSGA